MTPEELRAWLELLPPEGRRLIIRALLRNASLHEEHAARIRERLFERIEAELTPGEYVACEFEDARPWEDVFTFERYGAAGWPSTGARDAALSLGDGIGAPRITVSGLPVRRVELALELRALERATRVPVYHRMLTAMLQEIAP